MLLRIQLIAYKPLKIPLSNYKLTLKKILSIGTVDNIDAIRQSVINCKVNTDCGVVDEIKLKCLKFDVTGQICIDDPVLLCRQDDPCKVTSRCVYGLLDINSGVCVPTRTTEHKHNGSSTNFNDVGDSDIKPMGDDNTLILRFLRFPSNLEKY